MDPIIQLLLVTPTTFLLVPVCVLLGFRRPGGALIVSGGAALLVSILFWIVLGGMSALYNPSTVTSVVPTVLEVSALILLVAAWTLAIHAAATSGRWLWVFFLVVAGYISFLATYFAYYFPQGCYSAATPIPTALYTFLCTEPNSLRPLLFALAHVLGPAVVLIYGLVAVRAGGNATRPAIANSAGRRVPPPGLYKSAVPEEDTEPDVH